MYKKTVQNSKNEARKLLTDYLQKNKYRKTPERYAILDEIYSQEGHFDIDTLYHVMQRKNYRVSKATLYNTIDLLVDCRLVLKHQFGKGVSQFEKALGLGNHDHLICTQCGKVLEFYDADLEVLIQNASQGMEFEKSSHSLYVYGECKACIRKNA